MNLNNYKDIHNQLLSNNNKIRLLDKKINIINKNRSDLRKETALYLSTPIYIILTLLTISSLEIIPIITPLITLITSIIIGKIIEITIYHTNKYKQNLATFSTSKNLTQLLTEQTQYQIQKEQLLRENDLLEKLCTNIIKHNFDFEKNYTPNLIINTKDKEKISTLCQKHLLATNFKNYFSNLTSFKTSIKTGTAATISNLIIIIILHIALNIPTSIINNILFPSLVLGYYITRTVFDEDQIKNKVFNHFNHSLNLDPVQLINNYNNYTKTIEQDLTKELRDYYNNLIIKNTSKELTTIKDNTKDKDYQYHYKEPANSLANSNITKPKTKRKELNP